MNNSTDPNQNDELAENVVDNERRRFLVASTCVLGGVGAVCSMVPFISSWLPSTKTLAAGAPVEVDLSSMSPGEQLVVAWRGKPVWVIRRSKKMLDSLSREDESQLRDPLSLVDQQPEYARNQYRSIHPEYLVLIGVCTHLGCSPKYKPNLAELGPDWQGGFFCPCHGSTFDLAGRVFKGVPAPINLEVPPYRFINPHTIVIGEA